LATLQRTTEKETREPEFTPAKARFLLRRWRWVAVCALVGASIGAALSLTAPDTYVAHSILVATDLAVAPEDFGSIAQAAFSTDAVLQPVIERLGLRESPGSLLSSGALEAASVSGGPALRVTGRASDPRLAASLANAGAESFVEVAQEKGLGTLASFSSENSGTLQAVPLIPTAMLGLLAGASLAALALLGIHFIRDPIVTREDASDDFAADVAFQVSVDAVPAVRRMRGEAIPHDAFAIRPSGVTSRLWNAVSEGVDGGSNGACAVIVDGGRADWAARAIARRLQGHAQDDPRWRQRALQFSVLEASDSRLPAALATQDAVVAIVTSGAPRRLLRRFDEDLRASEECFRVLVLVGPRR
jgi:capsular polysaccharide biosynthesis protein